MDYNKLHDEALSNASKGTNALDSAIKSSSTTGQKGKDPMSSYERKQDEDVMRSALSSIFESIVSKSSDAVANNWRADFRMTESVHFYYYKYYSSSPIVFLILGILGFLVATSHYYLFASIFTVMSVSMLSASNPRVFFELQTRQKYKKVDKELKEIVFQSIFNNLLSLKNVFMLSIGLTVVSFLFLKFQFAIFGFTWINFIWAYNPNFELYGLFNALACFVSGYAKISERWA